jgi:biotin-(acetyl-CoA carboxylase) ligase
MLPAVAVVQAIGATLGQSVGPVIKWVNDVLIDGRKVAGVLTTTLSQERTVHSACFGVGINVARSPAIEPTVFVPAVGCLRERAATGDDDGELLWRVCGALLDALERELRELLIAGPGPLLRRYREASVVVGRRVAVFPEGRDGGTRVRLGTPLAEGVVEALNDDLSLTLRGRAEPVRSGRLVLQAEDAAHEVVPIDERPATRGRTPCTTSRC